MPTVALVTGPPGSGKSTLAGELARTLACPAISRDDIRAGIARNIGHEDKELVGWLAFDAFFRTLALLASCQVTVVADAAFQDLRWRVGLRTLVPLAEVKVIRCAVDPAIARERIAQRKREARRADAPEVTPFEPLSLPFPALTVATGDGYQPGLDAIVAFVTS